MAIGALLLIGGGISVAGTRGGAPDTIQLAMDRLIDPSADALWKSVGTVETARGEEQRAPGTAAEWATLRRHALGLAAGARLMQRPGIRVGGNGHGLADAETPGTRTATRIRADIDHDPARFIAAARRLEHASGLALAAIDARSAPRLLEAGARIDAACEACHAAYWYPRTRLTLPPPDRFRQVARRP